MHAYSVRVLVFYFLLQTRCEYFASGLVILICQISDVFITLLFGITIRRTLFNPYIVYANQSPITSSNRPTLTLTQLQLVLLKAPPSLTFLKATTTRRQLRVQSSSRLNTCDMVK